MIKKLKNPNTELYKTFKNIVLSNDFSWFFQREAVSQNVKYDEEIYTNYPFYSHAFLKGPDYKDKYPKVNSQHIELAHLIFLQIAEENNIEPKVIYRMNANVVHPHNSEGLLKYSVPHVDHQFPHKNMLIYLADTNGGDIVCDGESISPNEDDVVLLEGIHYIKPPSHGRRIVLVYTFLDEELSKRCFDGLKLIN